MADSRTGPGFQFLYGKTDACMSLILAQAKGTEEVHLLCFSTLSAKAA